MQGTVAGVPWANVFWALLATSAAPSQANLDAWSTTVGTAYKTRFSADLSGSVTFTQLQAQMFLPGGLVLASLVAITGTATGASTNIGAQTAQVLSWQTGVYWRGGKPRTYLPPPPPAFLDDPNSIGSGQLATLKTHALGFRTDVNAATSGAITSGELGLVSFVSGGAPRPTPVFYAFTDVKVHPRLGTQRRRLGRWLP